MTISVCTLAHGRQDHLANLVRGLNHSTRPPCELVVAVMQSTRYELPATSFPVRQIILGNRGICLAEARNVAAENAKGRLLVFLDVDCIPSPCLLEDYAAAAAAHDGVFMGEVGYLPKGATDAGIDYGRFEQLAVKHSERAGPPLDAVGRCSDYRCFWSLNFALSAANFHKIGGFDPRYVGYGGEDTDFGRMIASNGVPLWWARGAKAYHQYHRHHMPPVHHLDSVLANAMIFADKWGEPTMQHWLRAFRLMGLITPDGQGGWLKLREPGEEHLKLTRQQEYQPYASSSLVLEQLEEEARRDSEARFAPAITLA
ncbi:MAG: glycosyl transferase [Altererythrobacter sp.]|nr:glycosyl transferase [Altererythrobacter sp.]|tara:strand:- start:434 stop:1375 length:942 start_codon:yes stop_codon:yes gene_type:complete